MKIFSKNQGTFIKVVSPAVGLTVDLVLLAKVQLERRYNACIINKERVYEILEYVLRNGDTEGTEFNNSPGGIAPCMSRYIPEVEVAMRWTGFAHKENVLLEGGDKVMAEYSIISQDERKLGTPTS